MIGTGVPLLENLLAVDGVSGEPVRIVAADDGREAAEEALAEERAAVWVGPTASAAFEEFRAEVFRPRHT
jgi:hypothetical protein